MNSSAFLGKRARYVAYILSLDKIHIFKVAITSFQRDIPSVVVDESGKFQL